MKNFVKKYWTHILNLIFLIYYICLFALFTYTNNNEIAYSIGIALIIVIGILIEIVFFMVKVAKEKNLKNKPLHMVCIYLLNIFYSPCFSLKYIYKDNKANLKNIIYVITSSLLYILLVFMIFKFTLMDSMYQNYISNDNAICITLPANYSNDVIVGEFDMYFTKKNNFNIGVFLYDNTDKTGQDILEAQEEQLQKTRGNFKLIKTDNKYKNGKTITTHFCEGKYNNIQNCYYISTITFDEKENYVVCLIGISLEENNESNQKEFVDILEKLKLN